MGARWWAGVAAGPAGGRCRRALRGRLRRAGPTLPAARRRAARIEAWCAEHDLPAPTTRPAIVRSIVESLVVAFAHAVEQASRLSGRRVDVIHAETGARYEYMDICAGGRGEGLTEAEVARVASTFAVKSPWVSDSDSP